MKLTDEQKKHFGPMLTQTWQGIAPDAEEGLSGDPDDRVDEIIEITCDANHPEYFGGMTHDEYKALCDAYHDPDTKGWLREVLNY